MTVIGEFTYKRIKQIGVGEGQNSVVWLADDPQRGGHFAVKEIEKASFAAADVDKYFREAQTMFAVDHPNVVRVDCAFQTTDKICLGMKYFPDGSLLKRIDPSPLSPHSALEMAQKILAGLAHIHAKDFIHFDLKPSNILLTERGVPMIADFGQTRPAPGGVTHRPPMYEEAMPPECFSGVGAFQSDIYQVGFVLYRAVNGEAFFSQQRLPAAQIQPRTLSGKYPNRKKFLPHVPKLLKTAIRKALSVDPMERFPSAVDFSDALSRVPRSLDWQVKVDPSGEIEWRADRDGKPPYVVKLLSGGTDWKTEVWTDGTRLQRFNPNDPAYWGHGLKHANAMESLKTLFRTLG